jgi:hypothetical protein
MPLGKKLWWTREHGGKEFVVHAITPLAGSEVEVTLKLMTSSGRTAVPDVGQEPCFSEYTSRRYWTVLPEDEPWTHQPGQAMLPRDIED